MVSSACTLHPKVCESRAMLGWSLCVASTHSTRASCTTYGRPMAQLTTPDRPAHSSPERCAAEHFSNLLIQIVRLQGIARTADWYPFALLSFRYKAHRS
ncbi:hypothetical protein BV20DRAFT_122621 [Pilatotrama ljubarskyi]|nr:hypothetical protein BV20DRAFT_122621 [Pilatotrama ljubarskyi]